MDLWRISNHTTLNGEGGRRYAARWHTAGSPIVYLVASPPGSPLEILVHLELCESNLPPSYTLLRIAVASRLRAPILAVLASEAWKSDLARTRSIGDAWLTARRSASPASPPPSSLTPSTTSLTPATRTQPTSRSPKSSPLLRSPAAQTTPLAHPHRRPPLRQPRAPRARKHIALPNLPCCATFDFTPRTANNHHREKHRIQP